MRSNGFRSRPLVCVLVLAWSALGAASVSAAEEPADAAELIRMRVEQLAATGTLEAAGAPIAARHLIPRLYEARAFAPAWKSAAQIESLLDVVERSGLEGLDPRDYHVDAVRAALAAFASVDALPP
ncbi:MAG TPA: hypothetical protein VFO94_10350, partial [Gammaproteobacteria bacterium]|nr:hypothetical protein [Gammaproteobacteria bacterium]